LFEVGKVIHDSVNSMSFADDIRQISTLIRTFINKIDYGRDFEKQLNFYVECRRAFSNFDSVKYDLVVCTSAMAIRTLRIVRGHHTNKTAAFVRACCAFCFITIPSMEEVAARVRLYIMSGQVALINNCLPQAEALISTAVELMNDFPATRESEGKSQSTEAEFYQLAQELMSLLIVHPGHPELGAFNCIDALTRAIDGYAWEQNSQPKWLLHLRLVVTLSTLAQVRLPYHIEGVDSNDILYGGDDGYQADVQRHIDEHFAKVLERMGALKDDPDPASKRQQTEMAMEIFNALVVHSELNGKSATLAANLFTLAKKSGARDSLLRAALEHLRNSEGLTQELFKKLSAIN